MTSSGSVKVIYLDRDEVLSRVREAVARLVRTHTEIRQVILFGSIARGDAVPGSDVDLLLVLADSDLSFLDRIPVYTPEGIPIAADVFPYTETEMRQMLDSGNQFVQRALSEGLQLFSRGGTGRVTEEVSHGDSA